MGGRGCTQTYLERQPTSFAASCDAVLVVGNQEFPVHSPVLACHCKTFVDLFEVHLGYDEHSEQSAYDFAETGFSKLKPWFKLDSVSSPRALTASNFGTFLDHVYNPTEAKVESVSFRAPCMPQPCHSRA